MIAPGDLSDEQRAWVQTQWDAVRMVLERARPGFLEVAGDPTAAAPHGALLTFTWDSGEGARIVVGDYGMLAGVLLLVPREVGELHAHLYGLDGAEIVGVQVPAADEDG